MIKIFIISIFLINTLYGFKYIQYSTKYNNYITNLKDGCNSKGSESCCLSSVKEMELNKYYLVKDVKNCKNTDVMKCLSSYEWCTDDNYNNKKKKYDKKFENIRKSLYKEMERK